MGTNDNIIDDPENQQETTRKNKFDSRVPSDLLIVVGVISMIFGAFLIYQIVEIFVDTYMRIKGLISSGSSFFWLRFLIYVFLMFLYAVSLVVGGFGLFRQARFGWMLVLPIALFSVVISLLVSSDLDKLVLIPVWLILVFLVFFGGTTIFLLSGTIRDFFDPKSKHYIIAAVIFFTLLAGFLNMYLRI